MSTAAVPAALHGELTEYANLVRVLRTSRTLDLTTHLLHHAQQQQHSPDADTWTTWPLIDCPVPEWSLQDEIQHLADVVLRQQQQQQHDARVSGILHPASESASASDLDSDLQGLSPTATQRLVLHAGTLLARILNLMANQRPSAPGSMQNRLWPMNWQDVISLLAFSDVLDPSVISRAEKRLERIYGPSNTRAIERLALVATAKERFADLASVSEDQLFAPPVLHPRTSRSNARARSSRKSKATSRAIIDTDTDMDA